MTENGMNNTCQTEHPWGVHIDTVDYLNNTEFVKRQSKLYGYLVAESAKPSLTDQARHILQMSLSSVECMLMKSEKELILIIDSLVRENNNLKKAKESVNEKV